MPGMPVPQPWKCLRRLSALNDELAEESKLQERGAARFEIGIGINTGLCVVGNIGSDLRFDYSVLGIA